MEEKNLSKSIGGKARADALSPEKRKKIAAEAAKARWSLPKPEYVGTLRIGEIEIPCAVLPNGKRVVVQREVVGLLTGNKKGGMDRYLSAQNLLPYVPDKFKGKSLDQAAEVFELNGRKSQGYEGEDIVDICRMYLNARKAKVLLSGQVHLAEQAEFIVTVFAKVGITALIDEATGYQQVRARDALQLYLEKIIRKELAAWVKRFPDEFYEQIYRLKNWTWNNDSKRPGVVAKYTKDLVYERLGTGVLTELENKNPVMESGYRKSKHHQWLTDDIGHPQLAMHLSGVIALMRISDNWDEFKNNLNRAYPRKGDSLLLPGV
jgi:hypothetical protein